MKEMCALLPSLGFALGRKPCTNFCFSRRRLFFAYLRGMLLPYYKSDCPHMDVSGCWLEMLFFMSFLSSLSRSPVNFFPIAYFSSPLRFYEICKKRRMTSLPIANWAKRSCGWPNDIKRRLGCFFKPPPDWHQRERKKNELWEKKKETPAQQTEQLHGVTFESWHDKQNNCYQRHVLSGLKASDKRRNKLETSILAHESTDVNEYQESVSDENKTETRGGKRRSRKCLMKWNERNEFLADQMSPEQKSLD